MATTVDVNGRTSQRQRRRPTRPCLWVLRDELGLTGTKFGCGIAQCGACTVLVDGQPIRSCQTPISALAAPPRSPPSRAWAAQHPLQAGLGQARRAAVRLLPVGPDHDRRAPCWPARSRPTPTTRTSTAAMDGNICRCGTYQRIRAAIKDAAAGAAPVGAPCRQAAPATSPPRSPPPRGPPSNEGP